MGDLPPRVEIGAARFKLLLLTVAGILMTTVAGLIALRFIEDVQPGSFHHFVGWVGLAFFGFCTLAGFWRLLAARGAIVTIDAEGIRDTRISGTLIPWSSVRDITIWQIHRTRIMILAVDPEFARSLNRSRLASIMRGANRALGTDGLAVNSADLKIGHDELIETALAYWKRSVR